jgi:hypothetical protein
MRVKKFKLWGTLYAMAGGRGFTMVSNAEYSWKKLHTQKKYHNSWFCERNRLLEKGILGTN